MRLAVGFLSAFLLTAACFTSSAQACQAVGAAFDVLQYGYMGYRAMEARPGYNGCYKDDPVKKDFPVLGGRSNMLTILGCNSMCRLKKLRFFGVQNYDCWCGNVFGKYGKVDDDLCKIQCPGKPSETCGGYFLNAVYTVV
ncbi:hypothetical protein BOX15_Mlig004833g2 [Macrostomum lignano]|uniref:Uncharacterized protein n=2 Tax=Macrostomum lignano TaxID=282301 RepID=A0A267GZ95_9PLAT|nr:hypothetical protein BOX15_Mlig004833g1 [Macrostomum lignano]PAA91346.1 hypothetical protein BOX15_Mlig004833g2 [Macrostomum lignano]